MKALHKNPIEIAKKVIKTEISELENLVLTENFSQACHLILNTTGKLIAIGMGKSGNISRKIAATLASTGTPAFFVHPGEASHGDLGMIGENDITILVSNSGEANEILVILPALKRLGVPIIAMTGNANSTLAKNADVHLYVGVKQEACPLNLAPTSSTTNTLVMGDALAVTLLELRNFTKEEFAISHPAGALGKRLITKVADIMHHGDSLPSVVSGSLFSEALIEMSKKRLGMLAILNKDDKLIGIFTDGDLRRALSLSPDLSHSTIDKFMTHNFISVSSDILAESALKIMDSHNINGLLIVDNGQLVGALNMLDLLHAKVL